MRWMLALACTFGVGCVQSSSTICGSVVCSATAVCAPSGDRCVLPGQLDACAGKSDGDACSYSGVDSGACVASVCLPAGCGNALVEESLGELCDDGNRIPFDGCSADCTSRERCGDGRVDPAFGEDCDCGDGSGAVEGCSGANSDSPGAMCREDCRIAGCGDGIVDPGEQCDDGNNVAGDGCRADCEGRWTLMASNTLAHIDAVWASSSTVAYAISRSRVFDWNGTRWRAVTPNPLYQWSAIWGSDPDNVFLAGTNIAYRWNGSQWLSIPPPIAASWQAIYGRAANDVWIVGTAGPGVAIARWDGMAWTLMPAPSIGDAAQLDLWCSEVANDVYVADGNSNIHHFNGNNWSSVTNASDARGHLLAGTSSQDVIATGVDGVIHFGNGPPRQLVNGKELAVVNGLGAGPGESVAVGENGGILVCDSTTCQVSTTTTIHRLNGVWVLAPGRAFIVGENGTILH